MKELMNMPKAISPFVQLTNVFDPANETEPDWVSEIEEEVRTEALKFGKVLNCHVVKDSAGFVFLEMESVAAAQEAINGMHNRFFGGNTIVATSCNEFFYLKSLK